MADPIKVSLKHPIAVGTTVVTELTVRSPKAKDFKGISISIGDAGMTLDFSSLIRLAGRLTGQPDNVIEELDVADMKEVGGAVLGFIDLSPPTGTKP